MATQIIDLGSIRFVWKGDWNNATEYQLNDIVKHNQSIWVFINEVPSTGVEPGSLASATWDVMVPGLNTYANIDNLDVNVEFNVGLPAPGLRTTDLYTNPIGVFAIDADNDYAQLVVKNTGTGTNASTDIIAYADNGDDAAGYIDMGIASSAFADPEFTITGANDGYIFSVAPVGTTGKGNLVIATGDTGTENSIVFAAGGLASNNTQMAIIPDDKVHIDIATNSTAATNGALVVTGGAGVQGDISTEGDIRTNGQQFFGVGAEAFETAAGLTNARAVFSIDGGPYGQVAVHNADSTASTDVIVYADNGQDAHGWIDMGITGSSFQQTQFGITGENDGYIFMEAPLGTTGAGNLVLGTGANGTDNKIIFAAGGFASGATQMSITPDQNVHIEIPTPSTSATTGALTVVGGVGISGDMNIQGDVAIQGTITFGGSGTTVETSNLAVSDPMVFVGTNSQADITDLAFIGEYASTISTITKTISNKELTSNVATLTTSTAHTFLAGDIVVVTGVDATFNGTFNIIAVPTTDTFTYAKTATNVASTAASGSADVSARRKFAGIARDASDGVVKVFKDATTKPTTTVNFSEAGLGYGDLKVGGFEATGTVALPTTTTIGSLSSTEIGYLSTVTSDVQTQIDTKAPSTAAQLVRPVFAAPYEKFTNIATAATGTVTLDLKDTAVKYLSTAATGNFTLNFRGDASTTLNSTLAIGESATVVVLNTNGATAYYPTAFQIDGSAVTPKWIFGNAPAAGNINSIDSYSFTILKTASGVYTILASQNKFA